MNPRARPIALAHLRGILEILNRHEGKRTEHYEFLRDSMVFHSIALIFRSPAGYQKHHDLAMEYMRRVDADLEAWNQARDAAIRQPRIEIAQYVVEGTRSVSLALAAIERAKHIDDPAPQITIDGADLRVWLRGHYYETHPDARA